MDLSMHRLKQGTSSVLLKGLGSCLEYVTLNMQIFIIGHVKMELTSHKLDT